MTVRENILYGLDNISEAEMNAAARMPVLMRC